MLRAIRSIELQKDRDVASHPVLRCRFWRVFFKTIRVVVDRCAPPMSCSTAAARHKSLPINAAMEVNRSYAPLVSTHRQSSC